MSFPTLIIWPEVYHMSTPTPPNCSKCQGLRINTCWTSPSPQPMIKVVGNTYKCPKCGETKTLEFESPSLSVPLFALSSVNASVYEITSDAKLIKTNPEWPIFDTAEQATAHVERMFPCRPGFRRVFPSHSAPDCRFVDSLKLPHLPYAWRQSERVYEKIRLIVFPCEVAVSLPAAQADALLGRKVPLSRSLCTEKGSIGTGSYKDCTAACPPGYYVPSKPCPLTGLKVLAYKEDHASSLERRRHRSALRTAKKLQDSGLISVLEFEPLHDILCSGLALLRQSPLSACYQSQYNKKINPLGTDADNLPHWLSSVAGKIPSALSHTHFVHYLTRRRAPDLRTAFEPVLCHFPAFFRRFRSDPNYQPLLTDPDPLIIPDPWSEAVCHYQIGIARSSGPIDGLCCLLRIARLCGAIRTGLPRPPKITPSSTVEEVSIPPSEIAPNVEHPRPDLPVPDLELVPAAC